MVQYYMAVCLEDRFEFDAGRWARSLDRWSRGSASLAASNQLLGNPVALLQVLVGLRAVGTESANMQPEGVLRI